MGNILSHQHDRVVLSIETTEISQTSCTASDISAVQVKGSATKAVKPEVIVKNCNVLDNHGYGLYFGGVTFL